MISRGFRYNAKGDHRIWKGAAPMARYGFIHDKLDIKFLILYLMARAAAPIDFPTLTDLTMCDDGVDYFEFTEAVAELVETDHLTLEDGLYLSLIHISPPRIPSAPLIGRSASRPARPSCCMCTLMWSPSALTVVFTP